MSELGFEGHWLIDGASDADRATVIGLVPPIQRFILLRGFARRYRRHAAACWTHGAKPARRVQLENSVAVTVEADIDEVWDVVRDVTRVGEWSHECVGASWLGGSATPVPGARFRGRNRAGIFRWGRVCEIVSAEPYELVWRTVPTAMYPDSSEWRIALDEIDGGTRISQHFRVLRAPKVLSVLYALVIPAHRDRTTALDGGPAAPGHGGQPGARTRLTLVAVSERGPARGHAGVGHAVSALDDVELVALGVGEGDPVVALLAVLAEAGGTKLDEMLDLRGEVVDVEVEVDTVLRRLWLWDREEAPRWLAGELHVVAGGVGWERAVQHL